MSFAGRKYRGTLQKELEDFFIDDYKAYYKIQNEIGKSFFGSVFMAYVIDTKVKIAIKIINKKKIKEHLKGIYIKDEDEIVKQYNNIIDNFENEASILKECNICENSITYYDKFNNENEFAISMELCDENLLSLIQKKNKFEKEEIYYILIQLNNIFKIMEEKKIIHRDLKPENILIKYINKEKTKYIIKLSDYCVSKKITNLQQKCKTIIGTILTMAPEILNENEYNYKCDLWSLGVIIYLLVFGEYPYKGETTFAIKNKINTHGQNFLKHTEDQQLNSLIFSLLERDPERRLSWQEYFNHSFFNKKNE